MAPVPGDALGAGDPFVSGRVGMFASGVWAAAPFLNRPEVDYGLAPLPKGPKGLRRTVVKHNVLIVPAGVNGPPAAAAWELIKYLVGPENRKAVIDSGQSLNNLKELSKVRQGQAGVPAAVGLIAPRVNDLLRG